MVGAAQAQGAQRFVERASVFGQIDDAFVKGEIDEEHRVLYRVAALKAPHLLPARFRTVVSSGRPVDRCFTTVLVEAAQKLHKLSEPVRAQVSELLQPPTGFEYSIETAEPYPIRVFYNDASQQSMAELILDATITSYNTLVVDWGFWEPPIDPALGAYHIYIDETSMAGGAYTAPYEFVESTDHLDMFTYIVVDSSNNDWSLPGTMAHELNHSCQAAMDVLEPTAFWENTATYIMSQVFPSSWQYTMYCFQFFQDHPYRPLEYMVRPSNMFEYGGGLWVYFMQHLYGNEDPVWIREVWEDSIQQLMVNEPDYFDVLDEKLAGEGGFSEMVRTFAQYRYFASEDDDGQHLPNAIHWWDAAVTKEAVIRSADLPVENQRPSETTRPKPNGCNYIDVEMGGIQWPVRFSFQGDTELEWHVEVMKITSGQPTEYARMELDEQKQGEVEMIPGDAHKLVMVVCQLGGEHYDPDGQSWPEGDYSYSIAGVAPAPTVLEVVPATVQRGQQDVPVTVQGAGFIDDEHLEVEISGEMVAINSVEFVSPEQLNLRLVVAGSAELGFRDVIVRNPGGSEDVGEGLLEITDESTSPDGGVDGGTGSDPGGGCNCKAADRTGGLHVLFLMLIGLLGAVLLRRGHRR
jgi:MYXO-CTERM domain-containing protein